MQNNKVIEGFLCSHQLKLTECVNCKKLLKHWNKILEVEGHNAEKVLVNGERVLRQNAENAYRAIDQVRREAKESYFRLMSGFLANEIFSSIVHKYILIRICDGATIAGISRELESMGEISKYQSIRFVIRKYEMKWGVKNWKLKELTQTVYPKKARIR
jgi:hypothetical protein